MMRLYLASGQRALALRQYEICRLAEEFGVAPMDDTQALYAQISAANPAPALPGNGKEQTAVAQALGQLREANQLIELAKEKIQQVLQAIAQISRHVL